MTNMNAGICSLILSRSECEALVEGREDEIAQYLAQGYVLMLYPNRQIRLLFEPTEDMEAACKLREYLDKNNYEYIESEEMKTKCLVVTQIES